MKKINKAKYLKPIFKKIPDELKRYNQWVVWEGKEIDGKSKKVPYTPETNIIARVDDHKTWAEFNAAVKAYENGGYDGIGFVLTQDDPFFGFDFDKCRNPETRKIKTWAKGYIHRLKTYTEKSPSGKGIRGFAIGKLPQGARKKGDIEFYDNGHYLTVTGDHYPKTPSKIRNRQKAIKVLHSEIFNQNKTDIKILPSEDQALLKKAIKSIQGKLIKKLYEGAWSGYSSQSEADLALCNHLAFWFNRNAERIDRVFRTSKLYRRKWNDKHCSDGRTYGEVTIHKAIGSTYDTYQGEEDYIEELNKEYALVTLGSKVVVMREVTEPIFKRPDLIFFSTGDFKKLYLPRKVPNPHGGKDTTIANLWLESQERREYKRIVFSPGKDIPGCYNLYRGLAITPKKGDWSLFKEHIYNIIANRDTEHLEWILAWMARIVQDPGGERPGTSIVLRGKEGIGKGKYASTFGKLFGSHLLHLSNQTHLTGRFNSHLKDALFVFCDEGFLASDNRAIGVLKMMITEDTILIEPKHKDAFPVKNHINLVIASNRDLIVPAGLEERRFFVLDVSSERKGDYEYFKAIDKQMNNGGLEAMLYDLLRIDISNVNLREVPKTEALFEQIVRSMTSVQIFWYERLAEGTVSDKHSEWRGRIKTKALYKEYLKFCKGNNGMKAEINIIFSKQLKKLCPKIRRGRAKKFDKRGKRPYYTCLPNLDTCRRLFEGSAKVKINWE